MVSNFSLYILFHSLLIMISIIGNKPAHTVIPGSLTDPIRDLHVNVMECAGAANSSSQIRDNAFH